MTTPTERTRAVLEMAREVMALHTYASRRGKNVTVPRTQLERIVWLLRHYPVRYEMERTAQALPEVWGKPK